ncbi:MAG: hypothetical protein QOF52_722 [Propionibacteriaceae bacterium]|jgi:uncharacterized protein (DUF1697 family)|nr:hypothetical protein [Propionibacteriaceae bacterium]
MTAYAALLRGVNVGGKKVSMSGLRAMAESLGYDDVATYINSGNLLFSSTKRASTLVREIEAAISDQLGLSVDVAVRSHDQLRRVLAANPYPDGDPSRVTVAFLTGPPASDAEAKMAAIAVDEPFTLAAGEIYVHYTRGLGNSVLAQRFSKIIGVSATVRNIRTVAKLVELLDR